MFSKTLPIFSSGVCLLPIVRLDSLKCVFWTQSELNGTHHLLFHIYIRDFSMFLVSLGSSRKKTRMTDITLLGRYISKIPILPWRYNPCVGLSWPTRGEWLNGARPALYEMGNYSDSTGCESGEIRGTRIYLFSTSSHQSSLSCTVLVTLGLN